jgi:hypothetical protein
MLTMIPDTVKAVTMHFRNVTGGEIIQRVSRRWVFWVIAECKHVPINFDIDVSE